MGTKEIAAAASPAIVSDRGTGGESFACFACRQLTYAGFCMSDNASPLRVLHLTAGSDAGGVSRYLLDLTAAMAARGCRSMIAGERGAWHDKFAGTEWIDLPLKGGPRGLSRAAGAMIDRLRSAPVDVIHSHYRRATLVGRRVARKLSLPLLYTVHLSDISLSWPRRMFTDWGDLTHAPSEEAVRWLREAGGVPASRIRMIHHGIDPARFPVADAASRAAARQQFGLDPAYTVAAYVGRLDDPKNVDWLIDVARAAPDATILIAGDGPDAPALGRAIAQSGMADRLRMLGEVPPLAVYHAADALLLPSGREGFSLACAEAMCAGIPVLRTATAGAEAMILENQTGRATAIDRKAFVVAAGEFLTDRTALASMGARAAGHVRGHFTHAQQVDRMMALYAEMKTDAT